MSAGADETGGLPEGYTIPETDEAILAECEVQVFRSSGPGGQSVNTTDSAVRLVHRPTGLRVQCQRERSQLRNKSECLKRLRAKLDALGEKPTPRIKTRPSGRARKRRVEGKMRRSGVKRMRRQPTDDD